MAVDQEGRGCFCTEFRLFNYVPPSVEVETYARADIQVQVDAFRARLGEVRERELTPEERNAIVELIETIRLIVDETDKR
jgi:hypothetical protein